MPSSETALTIGGALAAVLLQALLAPVIAIGSIVPNFLLAYALAVALARPASWGLVLPFLLGLAFDLMGGGTVGAMALLLVLATLASKRLFAMLDNDTLFIPLGLLVLAVVLVEVLYGLLIVICGYPVPFGEALVFRCLPCALYDLPLAVALFLVMRALLSRFGLRQQELPLMR